AEPEITTNDNSIQILFSGNCLLAFQVGNMTEICQNGRCSIVKENLNPESYHAFDVTLFSIDGAHKESLRIKTKMAEAHIMISEVMHSPSGEPEKNHEFVEIYNATSLPFDLANCMIDDKNDKKGVDPLLSDETVLAPGATALIVGNESMIVAQGAGNILFVVDDTTIADAGLTSTESIQIICPSESGEEIVASYSVSEYGKRGFSVVIEKDGTMCDSIAAGGTPGVYSECP
ncbi:lamin tail domain-containing protein, partial [bacterium]|nr:lamin tail domain-containing protein [bacterium]